MAITMKISGKNQLCIDAANCRCKKYRNAPIYRASRGADLPGVTRPSATLFQYTQVGHEPAFSFRMLDTSERYRYS